LSLSIWSYLCVHCLRFSNRKKRVAESIVLISFPRSHDQVSTICGASIILGSMLYREHVTKRASTIRMRLVQGLVLSDLLLGYVSCPHRSSRSDLTELMISVSLPAIRLVGTITSSKYLSGKIYPHGSPFCDAFGILLVIILWTGQSAQSIVSSERKLTEYISTMTEHLWTFALAWATYMILIYVSP
jgi:hypothetical protein